MAPRILIFSIVLGAKYLSYVKSIETHARAFMTLNRYFIYRHCTKTRWRILLKSPIHLSSDIKRQSRKQIMVSKKSQESNFLCFFLENWDTINYFRVFLALYWSCTGPVRDCCGVMLNQIWFKNACLLKKPIGSNCPILNFLWNNFHIPWQEHRDFGERAFFSNSSWILVEKTTGPTRFWLWASCFLYKSTLKIINVCCIL